MSYGLFDHVFQISDEHLVQLDRVVRDWLVIKERQLGTTIPPTPWMQEAMRGARREKKQMSPDHVTFPELEESSLTDSRQRELSVIEAAALIGISPGHLWRLIREQKDPDLMLAITRDDSLRLDEAAITAYAAGRSNRRRAA